MFDQKIPNWHHRIVYGDDDLDSVLLGGDDSIGDGDFDPFDTGSGENDGSDDSSTYGYGPDSESNDTNAFDGLLGTGREIRAAEPRDDDQPLPWARGNQPVSGEGSARERAAADTGDRNVRRVADERTGDAGTGVARKQRSSGVADSIESAQSAIRKRVRDSQPLDDGERESVKLVIKEQNQSPYSKVKRRYERREIKNVPIFGATNFEATITGLKANTAGNWIVQFNIPAEFRDSATVLGDAYGLALKVTVERKLYDGH
jgi:hypothetical protein